MKVANMDMHSKANEFTHDPEDLIESADLSRLIREKEETLIRLEQLKRMIRHQDEKRNSEQTSTLNGLQKDAGLLLPRQHRKLYKVTKEKNWETGRIFYQRQKCGLTTNHVKQAEKSAENVDSLLEHKTLREIKTNRTLRSNGRNIESCINDVLSNNDAQVIDIAAETGKAMTQQTPTGSDQTLASEMTIGSGDRSNGHVTPMAPSTSTLSSPSIHQQESPEILLRAILEEARKSNEEARKQTQKLNKIIELLELRRFNNGDHEILIGVQNLVSLETVIDDPKWNDWARKGPEKLDEYMRTLALELASRVFFGDDVLMKSNALSVQGGKRKTLDRQLVNKMKVAVKAKTAPNMPDEQFDEKWKKIMTISIQNRCRNLRNQAVKMMTSSEVMGPDD